jgi:uncharacterized membrane protein YidH (DUF202 family)
LLPGASRERTGLSWRRTALAATVVALLFLRLAGPAAAVAVPGWLLVLAVTQRRIRAIGHARTRPDRWELPLVALAVVSLAVFGTALAVLP